MAYASVRCSLWRDNLPSTVQTLRVHSRRPDRPAVPGLGCDGQRLARAVTRMTARLPSGSRCLVRSLVLLQVLARHGIDSDLVIAVSPREQPSLDAHAWIEVDGRPLLAAAPSYGRLVTL